MKKILLSLILLFSFIGCEKEQTIEKPFTNISAKAKTGKVDMCHKGKIIAVSVNAIHGHQSHGDAVDMDGDGYFDIENNCSVVDYNDEISFNQSTLIDADGDGFFTTENPFSEIDCDDDSYSEDNSCMVMFEAFRDIQGWQYVQVGTSDNFKTFDITACSDFGEYGCSLSSPRLTQVENDFTYDGGPDFGTITLIFEGYDPGTSHPIYDIITDMFPSWHNFIFIQQSTYSASCYPCESMYQF